MTTAVQVNPRDEFRATGDIRPRVSRRTRRERAERNDLRSQLRDAARLLSVRRTLPTVAETYAARLIATDFASFDTAEFYALDRGDRLAVLRHIANTA